MKKQSLFLLCVVLGLFVLSGCGTKIKETINHVDTPSIEDHPQVKIALLPLADYTAGISPDDGMRRQVKLLSAIGHELSRLGVYSPVDEDVIQCLADLGIIKIINGSSRGLGSQFIEREMASDWSDDMRMEVEKVLASARVLEESQRLETKKIGLDRGVLNEIAQRLDTDYVLRGRIIEYEVRDGKTFNPFQRGILPFFFDFSSATIFGVAESDTYDLWQDVAIGGVLGAAFGASANHPFNAPDDETKIINGGHPRLARTVVHESGGFEDSAGLNAAFWGTAAAGAAYLASKGGKVPEAVVQVALALQDAHTGRVVWANRVEKEVEPVSVWSDTRVRTQVDVAVEEAARTLVRDLAAVLPKLKQEVATEEHAVWATKIPQKREIKPQSTGIQGETPSNNASPENWGS